jgi:hypothetical protein
MGIKRKKAKKNPKGLWRYLSGKCLPSMFKVLGSIPSLKKKKKKPAGCGGTLL